MSNDQSTLEQSSPNKKEIRVNKEGTGELGCFASLARGMRSISLALIHLTAS